MEKNKLELSDISTVRQGDDFQSHPLLALILSAVKLGVIILIVIAPNIYLSKSFMPHF